MTRSLGHYLRDPLIGALFSLEVNMAWDEKLQSLPQILIFTIIFYSVVLYKIVSHALVSCIISLWPRTWSLVWCHFPPIPFCLMCTYVLKCIVSCEGWGQSGVLLSHPLLPLTPLPYNGMSSEATVISFVRQTWSYLAKYSWGKQNIKRHFLCLARWLQDKILP